MPDDSELKALEQELAPGLPEPPKPDDPSATPPDGDGTPKPPDATKDDQPPKVEKPDGEGKADGDTPDPLGELAKDPKFLQKVLAHPELGPKFNRWADDAANKQVEADRRTPRGPTEAEIKDKLKVEEEDDYFSKITPEQLKEDLADPETGAKAAAAYGRFQAREQAKAKGPTPEQTEYNIQVAATRSLIVTYRELVDGSDLSDEVKAELQPEKFQHLGPKSLPAWGKAIYEALVQLKFDTEWESVKEEHLAKLDPERKGSGGGRPPGSIPDLMGTDSTVGLEQGLAAEAQKKK